MYLYVKKLIGGIYLFMIAKIAVPTICTLGSVACLALGIRDEKRPISVSPQPRNANVDHAELTKSGEADGIYSPGTPRPTAPPAPQLVPKPPSLSPIFFFAAGIFATISVYSLLPKDA